MAEIEPVTGSTGAPVETEPVGTPVATGGPPAVPPPPTRPAGMVRWGIALITLAVMVGVVSVGIALMAAGAAASAVQGWLPKDTVAYVEIRADFPGDQRTKLGDIIAKFPGFADQASLDAKVDEALDRLLEGSGSSWTGDIKPWLGGEVGVAVTGALLDQMGALGAAGPLTGPVPTPDDGFVVLVGVKDAAAARAWLADAVEGAQSTEQYAGGEITLVAGTTPRMAYAVRNAVLILGPEKGVKAALDTNGSSAMAGSADFAAARKTAPDAYLGYGYLDTQAYMDAILAMAKAQGGAGTDCLDESLAAMPGWVAGSARAEDDALVFRMSAPAAETTAVATSHASGVASRLPASTVAAIEIRDFGADIVAGFDQAMKQLSCSDQTKAIAEQVEGAIAGVGGIDAIVGWAGDTAIAVTVDGSTWGGGIAAVTVDEAKASGTVDQIQALLAIGGAQFGLQAREETYGSGTLLVVSMSSIAGSGVPELAVTAQDGIFALGTIDFVKAVVDTERSGSLAADPVYTRAIELAGGDGVADLFVDVAGIRAGVEAMLPADQKAAYDTEIKPFLLPLEAIASVAEAPGATTEARAVITFTK